MSKNIKFGLLLDGCQAETVEDVRKHFSPEDMLLYFRDGSLLRWLSEHGYEKEYRALALLESGIDDAQAAERLAEIFQVPAEGKKSRSACQQVPRSEKKRRAAAYRDSELSIAPADGSGADRFGSLIAHMIANSSDMKVLLMDAAKLENECLSEIAAGAENLYRRIRKEAPKAVFALLAQDRIRAELLRYAWIAGHLYETSESMYALKSMLGSDLRTAQMDTGAAWAEIASPDRRVMVLRSGPGAYVRSSGAIGEKIGADKVNGAFPVLNGLEYFSSNAGDELIYTELPAGERTGADLLALYVDEPVPLISVCSADSHTADAVIASAANGRRIIEFSGGAGTVDFYNKSLIDECSLREFLQSTRDNGYDEPTALVLKGVENCINDPDNIEQLRHIAQRSRHSADYNTTVFVVSDEPCVPGELTDYTAVFTAPVPSVDEMANIVAAFCDDMGVEADDALVAELSWALLGLTGLQAEKMLNHVYQQNGDLSESGCAFIIMNKPEVINGSPGASRLPQDSVSGLGGLDELKKWLIEAPDVFAPAGSLLPKADDPPKGILAACGSAAEAGLGAYIAASVYDVPLVRLDIGGLKGKSGAESEKSIREALKYAGVSGPCVLWVSGIEEAGAAAQVLLEWVRQSGRAVFVVADVEDCSKLPPGLLRSGVFSDVFFIDTPCSMERYALIERLLAEAGQSPEDIDIAGIAARTFGYSRDELEAVIRDAAAACAGDGGTRVSSKDLLWSIEKIRPCVMGLQNVPDTAVRSASASLTALAVLSMGQNEASEEDGTASQRISPPAVTNWDPWSGQGGWGAQSTLIGQGAGGSEVLWGSQGSWSSQSLLGSQSLFGSQGVSGSFWSAGSQNALGSEWFQGSQSLLASQNVLGSQGLRGSQFAWGSESLLSSQIMWGSQGLLSPGVFCESAEKLIGFGGYGLGLICSDSDDQEHNSDPACIPCGEVPALRRMLKPGCTMCKYCVQNAASRVRREGASEVFCF